MLVTKRHDVVERERSCVDADVDQVRFDHRRHCRDLLDEKEAGAVVDALPVRAVG